MSMYYKLYPIYMDAAEYKQLSFQDAGSPISEQLIFFMIILCLL